MNTISLHSAEALDKGDNSNSNEKWITIHPHNAEEGKGKHILLNAKTGEIEGGNAHLVKALEEKGAKVSKKEQTIIGKVDGEGEKPDFENPNDDEFLGLLEDGNNVIPEAPDFVPPTEEEMSAFAEEWEAPKDDEFAGLLEKEEGGTKSKFTDEQIAGFVKNMPSSFAKAWKDIIAKYPEEFTLAGDGSIVFNENFTHYDEYTDLKNKYEKEENAAAEAKTQKFTDEQINEFTSSSPSNYAKAWKDMIAKYPESFELAEGGNIVLAKDFEHYPELVALKNKYEKEEDGASAVKISDGAIEQYVKNYAKAYKLTSKEKQALPKIIANHLDLFKINPNGSIGIKSNEAMEELNVLIDAVSVKSPISGNGTSPSVPAVNALPPPPPAKPVSAELTEGGYPFPKDATALDGLTKVKSLGGASGAHATLYKDANGNHFVMKRYSSTDKQGQQRLKEECDADAYYLAGGAQVPHFKLYGDEQSGYTKLSQYIPDTETLGSVWHSASPEMKETIKSNLRKNFALDVMAGAWDVLGTGMDNVLVDKDGNVWRCDNGGAFNRRAQGDEKTEEQWGNGHIDDLWTMRGKSPSLDGETVSDGTGKADFFGDITTHQILSDIASRDWDKMITHLPDTTRQVMAKRIANAKEYHSVCDNVVTAGMYGDGQHAEDITLNYHCLNKFGAKGGCINKNVGPDNWGWCRGNNNSNPAPTLSQFFNESAPKLTDFTDAVEPQLAKYLPNNDVNQAANILKTADISLNDHLFVKKDGQPNMSSVNAALALKPQLEAVAKGTDANAKKAQEMLDYVSQIEAMKDAGFPNMEKEMPHSPSGEVDLNTPESKAAAEAEFNKAHAEWEQEAQNAQAEFEKAKVAYASKKKAAQKKLAEATKKWEAENGSNTFKWNNLTDCYEDFCKQNGIDSQKFWKMAKSQGYSSQETGSSRMKVLEILAMGGSLDDPYHSAPNVSDHTTDVKIAAQEFKSNPKLLEEYKAAYTAMKSLTQMILQNSSFTGNFPNKGVVRMCRTEDKEDVVNKYGLKHGIVNYPMGTHESFGVFNTFACHGHEAMVCDVPYSRISSIYFMKGPNNDNMYLGDDENEAGVNAVGLTKVYWKKVSTGVPITKSYAEFEKAMKKL